MWLLIYVLFGGLSASTVQTFTTGTIKLDSFEDCKTSGDNIIRAHYEETKRDGYYICVEQRGKPLN